jgi:hypothetical protein
MDGFWSALGSFLEQVWALVTSNTFLAAAGVIATIVVGGLGIWLEERSRRARHRAVGSKFIEDIRAHVDSKFGDIVDTKRIFPSYRSMAALHSYAFVRWFTTYREVLDSVDAPANMTTHQAFLYWWETKSHEGPRGRFRDYKDFKAFNITGAFAEEEGYRVGPPISAEEFAKLVGVDPEAAKESVTRIRELYPDQ